MASVADKKYVFEVAKDAGKIEIKNAVEKIFGVKVASVNTLTSRLRPSAWAPAVPAPPVRGKRPM